MGPTLTYIYIESNDFTQKAKIPQEECLKVQLQGTILRNVQIYLEANIHPQKLFGSLEHRVPSHSGEPGIDALDSSVQNLKFNSTKVKR